MARVVGVFGGPILVLISCVAFADQTAGSQGKAPSLKDLALGNTEVCAVVPDREVSKSANVNVEVTRASNPKFKEVSTELVPPGSGDKYDRNVPICVKLYGEAPLKGGDQITFTIQDGSCCTPIRGTVGGAAVPAPATTSTQLSSSMARLLFGYERSGASSSAPFDHLMISATMQVPFPSPRRSPKPKSGEAFLGKKGEPQSSNKEGGQVGKKPVEVVSDGVEGKLMIDADGGLIVKRAEDQMLVTDVDGLALKAAGEKVNEPWGAVWMDVRATGVPKTSSAENIESFVGALTSTPAVQTVNTVVQGGALSGGLEFAAAPFMHRWWQPFGDQYYCDLKVVVGAGFKTPFTAATEPSVFVAVNDETKDYDPQSNTNVEELKNAYPLVEGKQYIAFVAPDRNGFYRALFVGLRLKTHSMDGGKEVGYPGITDMTFGADESVTGSLKKWVFSVSSSYSLPIEALKSTVYIFGSLSVQIHPPASQPRILLKSPAAPVSLPNDKTLVVLGNDTAYPVNRDTWKLGVGLDLVALVNAFKPKQ